jgi:hypothetical protein
METLEQKLARIEAENQALRNQVNGMQSTNKLKFKIGEKGGLSIYGLGRFPVTLYKEQWLSLLGFADQIKAFIKTNDKALKSKADQVIAKAA